MKVNFRTEFVITVGRDYDKLLNLVKVLVGQFKINDIEVRESAVVDVASGEKIMDIYDVHCKSDIITLWRLRMKYFKTAIKKDGLLYIM